MKRLKRYILITGCSSGIGLETAKILMKNNWYVFASCRKKEDLPYLKKIGLDSIHLDYSDENSMDSAIRYILKKTDGHLDALFNNGAYALPGALEDIPTEGLREIFEINVFGWHTLIRKIIPTMRKQGYGRIIQCSSILGFINLAYRGPYNSTKWALESLTDTLRIELSKTNIKVISIRPGPIKTKIKQNSIAHFFKWVDWRTSSISAIYESRLIPRLKDDNSSVNFELKPEHVAFKVLEALETKTPRLIYNITLPTKFMSIVVRILPKSLLHKLLIYFSDPI